MTANAFKLEAPGKFTGKKEDWERWCTATVNYCSAIGYRYGTGFDCITTMDKTIPVDSTWLQGLDKAFPNNATDAKDVTQLDSDLYTALTGWLVDGARSHSLAEKTSRSGFAIWKRLVLRYEPLKTMKVKELMTEIVHYAFDDKDFMTSFDLWETKIGEHEALTGLSFDTEVKSTHLYQATTGALRIH